MIAPLFISEQQARSLYEYAPGFHDDAALLERHVWSPISCRHTAWTYRPLVQCDSRGHTIAGTRTPNPFISP